MKVLFKIWNLIKLISSFISLIIIVFAALGVGTFTLGIGGFAVLIVGIPTIISATFTIIMAQAGFSGNYEKCISLGTVVLVLDAFSLAFTIAKDGDYKSKIASLIISVIYVFLAKSCNNK